MIPTFLHPEATITGSVTQLNNQTAAANQIAGRCRSREPSDGRATAPSAEQS